MILYEYASSSASYRVRIALNLKNLNYQSVSKNLPLGEQKLGDFLSINSQGFVPTVRLDDGAVVTQSLAIIEYLEEMHPEPPLLPRTSLARARVRALSQSITSDIHPLNNLRVLRYMEDKLLLDKSTRDAWYRHWVEAGFRSIELRLTREEVGGRYCHGDSPTLADICLVPQVFNARRFSVDLNPYPRIRAIDSACRELSAFKSAAPP